jgi:histidyl-tRNA synthetase
VHYGGPIFRYERPSRGRSRQFTVVGLELIGASGAAADAEVLHLACAGLEAVGITRYRLVVGHLGAALQLLAQLGMSDHAQGLVLDQMEPIARGRVEPEAAIARVAALLGGGHGSVNGAATTDLPPSLADLPPDQATAVAADILSRASLPVEGGARQPRDIIQRLLAKARRPDPTGQVRAAFDFVGELHRAAGPPTRFARELRPLLEQRGLSTTPVDDVLGALELLHAYGPLSPEAEIVVDLSLARGLRYYTGLVFEIYVDAPDGPSQLCGGGRYDDLVRSLGGRESVPACGFQYGLERLDLALDQAQPEIRPHVLVVGVTQDDHTAALAVARPIRDIDGLVVEQDIRLRGVKAALRYADRAGIHLVAIVGDRERQEDVVVLRDMRTREEVRIPSGELAATVRKALP